MLRLPTVSNAPSADPKFQENPTPLSWLRIQRSIPENLFPTFEAGFPRGFFFFMGKFLSSEIQVLPDSMQRGSQKRRRTKTLSNGVFSIMIVQKYHPCGLAGDTAVLSLILSEIASA